MKRIPIILTLIFFVSGCGNNNDAATSTQQDENSIEEIEIESVDERDLIKSGIKICIIERIEIMN